MCTTVKTVEKYHKSLFLHLLSLIVVQIQIKIFDNLRSGSEESGLGSVKVALGSCKSEDHQKQYAFKFQVYGG